MGLDLALGVIILIAAFRGWFQGFISQSVRLGGLVACVYLAEPVRNYAKPYVLPYLPTIGAELMDRILWWVSAVVTFVVLVGFTTLVIKMTRRPEIPGIPQAGRNDQFAGFMLGACKGALIAAFATAGIQKFAMEPIKTIPWAEEQVKTSWALQLTNAYQPVPRIWASPPVHHFVSYIERMGLSKPGEPSPSGEADGEASPVRTASRPTDGDISEAKRPTSAHPESSSPHQAGSHDDSKSLNREDDRSIAELKSRSDGAS
jgi:uncharacterized membrane protein required for colicin V production